MTLEDFNSEEARIANYRRQRDDAARAGNLKKVEQADQAIARARERQQEIINESGHGMAASSSSGGVCLIMAIVLLAVPVVGVAGVVTLVV